MSTIDTPTRPAETVLATVQLAINGMHCASCVARVEDALRAVPGLAEATVSLVGERARVAYTPVLASHAQLEQAVADAGYAASFETGQDGLARQDHDRAREYRTLMRKFWFSAAIAVPVRVFSNAWIVPGLKDASWAHGAAKRSTGCGAAWRC